MNPPPFLFPSSPLLPVACSASRAIWSSSLLRVPVRLLRFGGAGGVGLRQEMPGPAACWRRLLCSYVGYRAPSALEAWDLRGVPTCVLARARRGGGGVASWLCAGSPEPAALVVTAFFVRRSHHRRGLGSFRACMLSSCRTAPEAPFRSRATDGKCWAAESRLDRRGAAAFLLLQPATIASALLFVPSTWFS